MVVIVYVWLGLVFSSVVGYVVGWGIIVFINGGFEVVFWYFFFMRWRLWVFVCGFFFIFI